MLPAPTRLRRSLRSLTGHELGLGVCRVGRDAVLDAVVRIERGIVLRLQRADAGAARVIPDLGRELDQFRVRLALEDVERYGEAGAAHGWRIGYGRSNQSLRLERHELSHELVVVSADGRDESLFRRLVGID